MKKYLIIVMALLFALELTAQRKVTMDKLQITKLKNAETLGTDSKGNLIKKTFPLVDLTSIQNELSNKLDKGGYVGTAQDLVTQLSEMLTKVTTNEANLQDLTTVVNATKQRLDDLGISDVGGLQNEITRLENLIANAGKVKTVNNTQPDSNGNISVDIPTNVSQLTNDVNYLTTETDPVFAAWDKDYNDLINKPTIPTDYVTVSQLESKADKTSVYSKTESDDKYGSVKTVNGIAPDSNGNVIVGLDNVAYKTIKQYNGNWEIKNKGQGFEFVFDAVSWKDRYNISLHINQNDLEKNIQVKVNGGVVGVVNGKDAITHWVKFDINPNFLKTDLPNIVRIEHFGNPEDWGFIYNVALRIKKLAVSSVNGVEADSDGNVQVEESDPLFSAWSKSYSDLTNKPTIPTVPNNVSAFTNDVNYLTSEADPAFTAWDKDYNDLINKPTIPTDYVTVSQLESKANKTSVYSKTESDDKYGRVKTVNGITPDDNGNVTVDTEFDTSNLVPYSGATKNIDLGQKFLFLNSSEGRLDLSSKDIIFWKGNSSGLPIGTKIIAEDLSGTNTPDSDIKTLVVPHKSGTLATLNDINNAEYLASETDPVFAAWDKDYNDLINKPTIPTDYATADQLESKADKTSVYSKTESDDKYGRVKTVNGIAPDDNGNVTIDTEFDTSNLVPYSGATTSLDLGSKSITASKYATSEDDYKLVDSRNDKLMFLYQNNRNIGIGKNAIRGAEESGNKNVAVGFSSGSWLSGDNNTVIGDSAGQRIKGNNNVAIGTKAGQYYSNTHYTNTIAIGYNTKATKSNQIVLGNASSKELKTSAKIISGGLILVGQNGVKYEIVLNSNNQLEVQPYTEN